MLPHLAQKLLPLSALKNSQLRQTHDGIATMQDVAHTSYATMQLSLKFVQYCNVILFEVRW
jgi:hypothetical protein